MEGFSSYISLIRRYVKTRVLLARLEMEIYRQCGVRENVFLKNEGRLKRNEKFLNTKHTHTHTHTHTNTHTHTSTHTQTQKHINTHHTNTLKQTHKHGRIRPSQRPINTQNTKNPRDKHPCPERELNLLYL